MMFEALYQEIIGDPTLAAKINAGGGRYHVYPLRVPDGVLPSMALTYTEIDQPLTYPLVRKSFIQFNCIAETFAGARGLADDIDRIFNDISETYLGGVFAVKYVKFEGRSSLPYDTEAKKFIFAVDLSVKF